MMVLRVASPRSDMTCGGDRNSGIPCRNLREVRQMRTHFRRLFDTQLYSRRHAVVL